MRFQVYPRDRLTDDLIEQAYLSGIDRVAWPVRNSIENGELFLQRSVTESAALHFPWSVEGHGRLMLATGTLVERELPYMLPLELARGAVNLLRTQLFEWQSIGLAVAAPLRAKIDEATKQLAAAVVEQNNSPVCAALSETSLRTALDAGNRLAACYIEQAMVVRRRGGGERQPVFLGGDLGGALLDKPTARQFLATFNAVNVPLCWRDIEAREGACDWTIPDAQIQWARKNRLAVSAGPLLSFDARAWPDWLTLWEGDFDSLRDFTAQFLRSVVERYRGQVDFWQAAARINAADSLALDDEEKLRLAALALEIAGELDPGKPAIASFDQPWAEYMSRQNLDFPPLHFADALIRSGLPVSGVGVEINLGYHPGGTQNRTLLEFSRLLDLWNIFGLPLWISLCVPSAAEEDPLARRKNAPPPGEWTPAAQQAWVARYLPLMLAKPSVQGIYWNQLGDSVPHDFPHGGLFDVRGKAKSALRTLALLRQAMLKGKS
ncbi:MAG: hypothetical protein IT426_04305 [Pirellulales bacterium]|nr:hypothetical protein [Pirellulales bacterium]